MDRLHKALDSAIELIEWFVVFGLVVLSVAAAYTFVVEVWHLGQLGFTLSTGNFNEIIGTLLEIFILVELFRIAVAYMEHRNVIPTVLEAAIVAVARKFVVFESADNFLAHAAGLSALLLAVAITSWLLARSHTEELHK